MENELDIPVIIAIIIVVGVSAFFELSGDEIEGESYTPSVGDNLKYKVNGFVPSMGNLEGTIEIRITSVSENSYTFSIVPSDDLLVLWDREKITRKENEPITSPLVVEKGEFIGKKDIVTDVGTIETDHYRLENRTEEGREKTDCYLENETNTTIKMRGELPGGTTMNMIVVSTNIEPLEERFE